MTRNKIAPLTKDTDIGNLNQDTMLKVAAERVLRKIDNTQLPSVVKVGEWLSSEKWTWGKCISVVWSVWDLGSGSFFDIQDLEPFRAEWHHGLKLTLLGGSHSIGDTKDALGIYLLVERVEVKP